MIMMKKLLKIWWMTGMTAAVLCLAAGCAAAIGLVLFPASLITLGAGAFLGYKGCNWLRQKREGMEE